MRKVMIVALTMVVGAIFSQVRAQQLVTPVDSLSYSFGLVQSKGLVRFLQQFHQEVFGNDSTQRLDIDLFLQAFNAGVKDEKTLMTVDAAQELTQHLIQSIKSETAMKLYGANKKDGEDFLKANAKKKGIKTLACGVQYKVLQEGKGAIPTADQKVKVHYEGRTLDGTVFDSSYKRGEPTEFGCKEVIKGWTETLTHMPVGSIWEVYIPQELAYGDRQAGKDIKPFSMLIFKIELLEIKEK